VLIGLFYCFMACVQAKVDRLIRAACSGMVHWKVLWRAIRLHAVE